MPTKRASSSSTQDGMEVTEPQTKKPRTAPTNTSLLPPCKVCFEPAAGFHYGVNTCEACKGFFRRSLLRKEEYKCHGNGNCNIRAGKRKICPKCRHLRCLAVGMSLEAVKTGRYTHSKRTQDILEYQQVMMALKNCDSNPNIFHSTPDILTTTSVCRDTGRRDSQPTDCKPSPIGSVSSPSLSSLSDSPASACKTTPSSYDVKNLFDSSAEFTAVEQDAAQISQDVFGSLKRFDDFSPPPSSCSLPQTGSSQASPVSAPQPFSNYSSDCGAGDEKLSTETKSFHGSSQSFHGSASSLAYTPPPSTSQQASTSSQPYLSSPKLSPFPIKMEPASCPASPALAPHRVLMGSVEEDAEIEELVTKIVRSHDQIMVFPADFLTQEDVDTKMRECHEACKIKQEMFGSSQLSEPEYQDIYKATGLDVDNRQTFIGTVAGMQEQNIKRGISFMKSVPGFSQLPLTDQVQLIKDNRCEFRMLCFYHRYHVEWRVYVMPSGQTVCIHQLQKLGKDRCLDDTFECARVLQDLALAQEEVILLKMLVIGTVGRTDVNDSEAVSRFQWSMARCLLWLFRRNRGVEGDRTFARTMLAICRVRDLCREFYEWIDSNPYENYTQYQNNGFLAEWFSAD